MKLCNPRLRNELRLRRERPEGLFQHWSVTREDRYPRIFSFVRDRLVAIAEPRILSFGCSTGEEVFTLRKYFPTGRIVGIDISPWNVAVARWRLRRKGYAHARIVQGTSPAAEPDATFDAIFCMAVFRSGDLAAADYPSCDHLLRFADFERTLVELDRTLKPGGLLAIVHSNFRFADTTVATRYRPVCSGSQTIQPKATPLYGPDNRKQPPIPAYNEVVFRKAETPIPSPPAAIIGDGK